jgi:hypothetical protein
MINDCYLEEPTETPKKTVNCHYSSLTCLDWTPECEDKEVPAVVGWEGPKGKYHNRPRCLNFRNVR